MQLLPALDLRGGGVVRLLRGDDRERTVYEASPHDLVARYRDAGVERVHVVDLDAAFGEEPQCELLEELVDLGVALQVGGGLRSRDAVEWALGAGCDRVVLTSLLTEQFDLFAELAREHPWQLVPALDQRDGTVRTHGWTREAGEPVAEIAARLRDLPIGPVLVTDISRDGAMSGANVELARDLARATGGSALLSGGVSSLSDLERAATVPELEGAIVGKALLDGTIELEAALDACGRAAGAAS